MLEVEFQKTTTMEWRSVCAFGTKFKLASTTVETLKKKESHA
jgi:hypothetical protein